MKRTRDEAHSLAWCRYFKRFGEKEKWYQSAYMHAMYALSSVAQSCPALCYLRDHSPPGSFVHGVLQTSTLEWVAFSSSRGSSQTRDQTHSSCISCSLGGFFTTESPGKPEIRVGLFNYFNIY